MAYHSTFSGRRHRKYKLIKMYEIHVKPSLILTRHGITSTIQHLRRFKYPGQEVCVVEAGDMDTASWSTAACAPLKVFVENGALSVADKIQVEIRNPTEFNCDRRWAHLLLDALRKTSDGVADAVKASLGDFWSLISYHMQVN